MSCRRAVHVQYQEYGFDCHIPMTGKYAYGSFEYRASHMIFVLIGALYA